MGIVLSKRQRAIALGTCREAKHRGLGRAGAVVGLMTQKTESGLKVLANANVPVSKTIPHDLLSWSHDGLGHDHASVGSCQQQTGYAWVPAGFGHRMDQTTMNSPNGWGTPHELMDFQKGIGKFYDHLEKFNWKAIRPWQAAQRVQGSAFSDGSNYRKSYAWANAVATLLWPLVSSKPSPKPIVLPAPKPKPSKPQKKAAAGKAVYIKIVSGMTLSRLAEHWDTDVAHLQRLNAKKYPSIVKNPGDINVGWKVRVR